MSSACAGAPLVATGQLFPGLVSRVMRSMVTGDVFVSFRPSESAAVTLSFSLIPFKRPNKKQESHLTQNVSCPSDLSVATLVGVYDASEHLTHTKSCSDFGVPLKQILCSFSAAGCVLHGYVRYVL